MNENETQIDALAALIDEIMQLPSPQSDSTYDEFVSDIAILFADPDESADEFDDAMTTASRIMHTIRPDLFD